MLSLQPIFASIRKHGGLTCGIGFLHPITDRVTISAHGCASHSWSRKVSAGSEDLMRKLSVPGAAAPVSERKVSAPPRMNSGYSTLPRVGEDCECFSCTGLNPTYMCFSCTGLNPTYMCFSCNGLNPLPVF